MWKDQRPQSTITIILMLKTQSKLYRLATPSRGHLFSNTGVELRPSDHTLHMAGSGSLIVLQKNIIHSHRRYMSINGTLSQLRRKYTLLYLSLAWLTFLSCTEIHLLSRVLNNCDQTYVWDAERARAHRQHFTKHTPCPQPIAVLRVDLFSSILSAPKDVARARWAAGCGEAGAAGRGRSRSRRRWLARVSITCVFIVLLCWITCQLSWYQNNK